MKVGVFHPSLDFYGGAEFVAVVMANTLAQNDNEVELFVNKQVDQRKTEEILGERVSSSVKIIVKPTFLQPRGMLDLYQNMFKTLTFKSKCDILIDTYSNCVFPWSDICYIHFPFLNCYYFRQQFPYLKSPHFAQVVGIPYVFFEKNLENYNGKLLLANSHYTAEAVREFSGIQAEVLYPPVLSTFFCKDSEDLNQHPRKNLVVTVSRFGVGKGLEKIPYIAKLTDRNINFAVIGLVHDKTVLQTVLKSINKLGLTNRVKIFTNISKREMKMILNSAKLYLHTTVGEHFGISIVEAMAAGCIPIVHNSGGVKEFVPTRYRYENLRDAATRIETEICEWTPEKAKEMKKIAERFSGENFSREFIKIFNQYVADKKVEKR